MPRGSSVSLRYSLNAAIQDRYILVFFKRFHKAAPSTVLFFLRLRLILGHDLLLDVRRDGIVVA